MNAKRTITIMTLVAFMFAIGAETFEIISFQQEVYSKDDPLGVIALTNVQSHVQNLETIVQNTVQKGQLTNDVVIVGNAKGANGAGMESTTTSIVFAVNRDIDDISADNDEILFSADKVRFNVGLDSIKIENKSLATILENAGKPLSERRYDFSTNHGLYGAIKDIIEVLGGSVTNFPQINQ